MQPVIINVQNNNTLPSYPGSYPLPGTEDSVSVCYMNEWMGTTAALQMGDIDMNAPGSPSRK